MINRWIIFKKDSEELLGLVLDKFRSYEFVSTEGGGVTIDKYLVKTEDLKCHIIKPSEILKMHS